MVLFVVLGIVILMALGVLGVLFYMLSKEQKKEEGHVVPVTDLDKLKKELSGSALLEPQQPKPAEKEPDVVPPFEPQVSMPVGPVQVPVEDDEYKKRAQELEIELQGISLKAGEQVNEAKQMIETLTEENESLKRQKIQLDEAQEKLTVLQSEADGLKAENTNIQSQLEAANGKVQLLEEQMAAVKLQMGDEIAKANATVTELAHEKESMLAVPVPGPDAALHGELESLKTEMTAFKQKYDDLDAAYQKSRALNTHLMEKNEQIEYEMVKAKAQTSGLERVSYNYKNQLDDFFKKMNSVETSNRELSEVKSRLEGMLEEIKNQNEDLTKKDQLSQFELEKNRLRLGQLEREYENLKAIQPPKEQA